MIRPSPNIDREQSQATRNEPIVLSPEYLAAIHAVEQLPGNQDGAEKGRVHRAMENVHTHFAKVKRA